MTKFLRIDGLYKVMKSGLEVATIRKAKNHEQSDWGNWLLEHGSGRVDRHHYLSDAKSDALKI